MSPMGINLGKKKEESSVSTTNPYMATKNTPTRISETFQSLIFGFGGSLLHATDTPLT